MRRTLLALLLPLLAVAAPVPKSLKKSADYFPVAVGHTWVYAEGDFEEVVKVLKTTEKDGVTRATIGRKGPGLVVVGDSYVVNGEGVWRTRMEGDTIDPPPRQLQFPLKAWASWASNGAANAAEKNVEVGESEEVTVPAGTFIAVPVRHTYGGPSGQPLVSTCWYAPGVGLVKITHPRGEKVLKSFIPGTDAKK